ncbi:hypothetical protein [Mesorhizobium sp. M4B.F.Ca.ET.013.02.1.1]|uniref:hypothetical protein n=1 Tax=Mesorhizobium sp. M4B.F.Ca.ET.013.02.1.1 TaxID=2496755 RepID=UPI000FD3F804|nr:hypothetical protein [Mesorhizobium sp. M4B.F.Ca.ET.013.02.1.1]RUW19194.1 hypothetical protein EOA34_30260 [Mesorhizobium sp. M4B.F.Ca.ET.013.02.1.1]
MLNRGPPFPCDVFKVAGQCGIRILNPDQHYAMESRGRVCFAPRTLKRIGRAHGEDHLRLVLRLIVESEGNAQALQGEVIAAVSNVVLSGLVEIRADLLDNLDLEQLRVWAHAVRPKFCSSSHAMTVALLWRFASPEKILAVDELEPEPAVAPRHALAISPLAGRGRRLTGGGGG